MNKPPSKLTDFATMKNTSLTRRHFLQVSLASSAGMALCPALAAPASTSPQPKWGVCQGPSSAPFAKAAGYDFLENGVQSLLVPSKPEVEFATALEAIRKSPLPFVSCNGFFPAELKLTGPATKTDEALAFAKIALERAEKAGVRFVVLGSGKARAVPEGFDAKQARAQFVAFCQKLGPIAAKYHVTIVLEPLNRRETNFFNSVSEGIGLVDDIRDPSIQLLADIYHMLQEDESPDSIRKAGARLRHCHIAEKAKRTPPGFAGDDFKAYFRALKDIGYAGGISIEAGPLAKEPTAEMTRARQVMVEQWNAA